MKERLTEDNVRAALSKMTFQMPVSQILLRAKRRRMRRRLFAALPVIGLLAAWGATALTADELSPNGILCYDRPPNQDNYLQWPNGNTGEDPRAICGRLWASGKMVPGTKEVPPLKVCAWNVGAVVVFPAQNGETCQGVGLQEMPEGYKARVDRFVAMRNEMKADLERAALSGSGPEEACLGVEEAHTIVADVLRAHDFNDWTVSVVENWSGRTQEDICMQSIELDSDEKEATIFSTGPGVKSIYVF